MTTQERLKELGRLDLFHQIVPPGLEQKPKVGFLPLVHIVFALDGRIRRNGRRARGPVLEISHAHLLVAVTNGSNAISEAYGTRKAFTTC